MKKHHFILLIFLLIVLVAFAMRLYRLDAVPLRGDEAYSVLHWTAPPFSDRWQSLIRNEPAPYGAFTLYWAWHGLAGASEFSIRYLSLLGNVLGLAACVVLARRLLHDWRLALLAGVLWAFHANLIWHAQDARTYGILSASVTLTFYWLLRALEDPAPFRRWWPYILLQSFSLAVYYLEPLWMAAQLLFVLVAFRRALWPLVRAWVMIGVLWLPVGAQLYHLMFVSQYQGNAESAQVGLFLTEFAPTLLFGESVVPMWLGGLIVAGLIAGFVMVWRQKLTPMAALLLACWLFLPLILLYGVSFVSDFFRPRYVMPVIPALIIALVAIFHALGTRLPVGRRSFDVTAALCAAFVVISGGQVYHYFFIAPPKAGDWPGLVQYLDTRTTSADVILSDSVDPALEYYYNGAAGIFFTPYNAPVLDYLPDLLTRYNAVFLLSGERTGDAGAYLMANAQHIPGDRWPGVVQYRRWRVNPAEIATPLDINLGTVATLRGYTQMGTSHILLYLQADSVTEVDHSILLHLQDADGRVIALDHAPAAAVVSTRTWTPGTVYRDPVALPVEILPGEYTLYVGMYPAGQPDGLVNGRVAVGVIVMD